MLLIFDPGDIMTIYSLTLNREGREYKLQGFVVSMCMLYIDLSVIYVEHQKRSDSNAKLNQLWFEL